MEGQKGDPQALQVRVASGGMVGTGTSGPEEDGAGSGGRLPRGGIF